MLLNHAGEHYSFLEVDYKSKNRTKYYAALAKIIFSGDSDTQEHEFHAFGILFWDDYYYITIGVLTVYIWIVVPFTRVLQSLAEIQDSRLYLEVQVKVSESQ